MAIPITVRCECGETHSVNLGDVVDCACGRRYDTSELPSESFSQVRKHQAWTRLYMRLGVIWLIALGLVTFLLWGKWGAAVGVPLAALIWFLIIRRWFFRRFVPSPGELRTFELEASNK